MSHALTNKATVDFLQEPTVARFKSLQQQVFASARHDPTASTLRAIESGLANDSPSRLLKSLDKLSSDYAICPRFHYVEARIRESLGELELMQTSIGRLKACLSMIAETGEGTPNSPFAVTFLTDMDDLVRSFGEQVRCQQPETKNAKQFDVLTAHSGEEFWFDVSPMTNVTAGNSPKQTGKLAATRQP